MRTLALGLVCACAGHYRTAHVGQGFATIQPRGAPAVAAQTIQLAPGSYDLMLRFDVPRAQLVEWTVSCPGSTTNGSLGEPFEAYRTRRRAQLRERPLIGGVALHAAGVTVTAAAVVPEVIDLPPSDVGAGRLATTVHVATDGGPCSVTALADDANVFGNFDVVEVRDPDAEARQRIMVANTSARRLRGALVAQLAGLGADATLRGRQRVELAAVVETRRLGAVAIEVTRRDAALGVRGELRAQLVACGAEVDRERRLRAEAEAHAAAEFELRRRRDAELEAVVERRADLARSIRGELRASLVAIGARERPPMPALLPEDRGSPPIPDAAWIAGHWTWTGAEWSWVAGGWHTTETFGETGDSGASAVVVTAPAIAPAPVVLVPAPIVRVAPPSRPVTVRDHRTTTPSKVRDHR